MKVLHVTNDYANNGTGITNLVRTLVLAQQAQGLDVTVAADTAGSDLVEELRGCGISYLDLPTGDASAVLRAARTLRRRPDVDIVHVHTVRGVLAVLGAGGAVRNRAVATVHNVFSPLSALMSCCAATVCISVDARDRMRRRVPWRARGLRVVHNAVDGTRSDERLELSSHAVVYVGGLHHRKGVDLLLDYFAPVARRVPDARLHIVGNRDQPHLEELAHAKGLAGRVDFAGFMPNPRPAMSAATVMVIPSRDEPFGLVAAEARMCGAPIIASDIGGLREALDGGAAAELVAVGDVDAWATAIERALTDPRYRQDLAARSRTGTEALDPERMERAYRAVYREVTSGRPVTARVVRQESGRRHQQ